MWTYHAELIERAVPRYTSYPTAVEFAGDIGERDAAEALARVGGAEPVSLYVHIPFCREICWYCGCNTAAANRSGRLAAYVEALEAEIDLVADRLGGRGRIVRIAFGGGSPNALSPLQFVRLLDRLTTRFNAGDAALSIELDPRTLDANWSRLAGEAGVGAASLGVQTFAPHVQQAIGRVQPEAMIARAVTALRAAGVGSINFDLMYGLPGQSEADLADTLDRSIALRPDRLAVFGYAHLPQLLVRQRRIDGATLPGPRARFAQAALAHQRLIAAGYRPVGFDHFALPDDPLAQTAQSGRLRRNFQGFTEDGCETLIGLGSSAISRFPDLLVQNEKIAGRYRMLVTAGRLPAQRGVRRSADDVARGAVIERLLCDGSALPSAALLRQARTALAPFVDRGLVRVAGRRVGITPGGLPYARMIASCFDGYRPTSQGMFSHAV